jgi:hypothetical protein
MRLVDVKGFVDGWQWLETTIEIKDRGPKNGGADWFPTTDKQARIEIGTEADVECVYHEIFHSASHHSPLHQGKDEAWGDAWCDTFRYFHDPNFKNKIDRFCEMSYEQAKEDGDWNHDRRYAYPCSLIVKACRKDYCEFKRIWLSLCQRRRQEAQDILDGFFGYDMGKGVPIC